ncbi:glutaredoxin [Lacimicrobium sp. SS2-24]|uniref:glutaredoxin family protein n=1 Tax=Lacimicrobium sp. SS2-24 TaxID=2005569 RepID=UPI000B4BACE1|nr:glutaredoxin [Lacimicrobium sp. SS2-24]
MRIIVRYFFRAVRLILTPFMLLSEKLTTPKAISRSSEAQKAAEQAAEKLALYQYRACPFCIKVRKQIARLGLPVEKRDALKNPIFRKELEQQGGKIKVPCLRIDQENGQYLWLYESDQINAWLTQRFGQTQ